MEDDQGLGQQGLEQGQPKTAGEQPAGGQQDQGVQYDPNDPNTWPEEVKQVFMAGAQALEAKLAQEGRLISNEELEERRRAREQASLTERERAAREFERQAVERAKTQLPEGLDPKARDKIAGALAKTKIEATSEALALGRQDLEKEIQQLRTELRLRDERAGWEKLVQYDPSLAPVLDKIQTVTKSDNMIDRVRGMLEFKQTIEQAAYERLRQEQEEESRRASMPSRVDMGRYVLPPNSRGNAFSAEHDRSARTLADKAVGAKSREDEEAALAAYLQELGVR